MLFIILTVVTIQSKPVPLAQASHELRNLENHLVTFGQSSWDSFKVNSCTPWPHITVQRLRASAAAELLQADQDVDLPCTAPALLVKEDCVSVTVLSHLWMHSTMRRLLSCALRSSSTA